MTNTTTSEQIDNFVTEANKAIISTLPNSIAKAFYIDLPICMLLAPSSSILKIISVAATTYEIRSQIKNAFTYFEVDKYFTDNSEKLIDGTLISGAAAGLIGGAFRYYITNQNPVIGALNNAAYETCNNIELCANNKIVNIVVTISIETLDATAQALLKASTGNTIGAVYSAMQGGALVGTLVASTVYGLYVPSLEQQNPEYNIIEKYFNSSFDKVENDLVGTDNTNEEL